MKRSILFFLCALSAAITYGYDFEEGGIYYTITSSANMTAKVTSGSSYGKYYNTVNIPDKVQHGDKIYYVTAIDSHAFSSCTGLDVVNFNAYITSVGSYAFSGCNAMVSITIPANVTSIGNYAFSGCVNLTIVNIEDSNVTLSLGYGGMKGEKYGLFADCPVSRFYWGRPLKYNFDYGYYAPLANKNLLNEFTIGPNVTSIPPYMFYGNTSFSTIELPTTVTALDNHAFDGFIGLTSFTIPKHITSIGTYAFANCTGLTSMTIPDHITVIDAGTFKNCTGLTSFVIPSNVTKIGNFAFNGCTSMTGFVIEESEENLSLGYNYYNTNSSSAVGKGLFYDCPLKSVFIGRPLSYKTDNQYGYSPFGNNETLVKAHLGNPVTAIQSYLFYGCKSLSTFQYNSNCKPTAIESYAFANCNRGLTSYDIPETVTSIGTGAFKGCEKLAYIVIKPAVGSIGNYAFNGCTSLTGVTFEESEESLSLGYNYYNTNSSSSVGKGLFYDCPLQSVFIGRPLSYKTDNQYGYSPFGNNETLAKAHFGNPLKTIQSYLFAGCKSLKTLQYNSKCAPTSIDSYAFWSCYSLTEADIVYPESVQSIGDGAFSYCTSLEGYTIPNHIKTVGKYAFRGCEKLQSVVVKPSVQSIGIGSFNGCVSMTGFVIEESEEYLSLGYNYYNTNSSSAVGKGLFYDCPLESVFIGRPLSYKTDNQYGYSPFGNNETLVKAHLGNPVTAIQSHLFYGCKSLNTFQYNSKCKPTAIESYAFAYCNRGLTSYDIPETVTSIGNGAFYGCEKLTSIVIKPAVTSIGNFAFNGCTSLTGVTFEESEESLSLGYNYYNTNSSSSVGKGLFYDCPLESVFIGRPLSYKTNNQYGYSPFANNEIIESAHFGKLVTSIPSNLFRGDTKMNSVVFDEDCKLESVGGYSFDGCKKLLTPEFPNTITSFEDGAFNGCAMLTDFDLPENLVTIGKYAFQNCTGLTTLNIPVTTTGIGNYAYNGCSNLIDVTVKWAKPITIYSETFSNRANATLNVPYGTETAYRAANYWKEFKDIVQGQPEYVLGDANGDGKVDINDALCIVNYVLNNPLANFNVTAADVDGDGEITITDAVDVVNAIMNP